jgi:hypothetical protein
MRFLRFEPIRGLLAACAILSACTDNGPAADFADAAPTTATLTCFPNLDGRIDNSEFPPLAPFSGQYDVSSNKSVNMAGTKSSDGTIQWHLDFDSSGDSTITLVGEPLGSQWYASSFPGAQAAIVDDPVNDVVDVLSRDDQNVWLYGLTSQKPASKGGTLLVYDQPIPFLKFPLRPGLRWSAVAQIKSGTYGGLPVTGTQTLDVDVDALGEIFLPGVTFGDVLRVRRTLTTMLLGSTVVVREGQWFSECVGEVARAVSMNDETQDNFTFAASVRRVLF